MESTLTLLGVVREPTEGASRQPCAVVSYSGTAWRLSDSRVGKICRYQSLARIRRQSRDNVGELLRITGAEHLVARNWHRSIYRPAGWRPPRAC
jgi:hypothetical protein